MVMLLQECVKGLGPLRITCMDRQDGLDEGGTSALLQPFQMIDTVCFTNSSLLHEIHQSSPLSTFKL